MTLDGPTALVAFGGLMTATAAIIKLAPARANGKHVLGVVCRERHKNIDEALVRIEGKVDTLLSEKRDTPLMR